MIRSWFRPGRRAAAAIVAAFLAIPGTAMAALSDLPYDVGSILMLPGSTPGAAPRTATALPLTRSPNDANDASSAGATDTAATGDTPADRADVSLQNADYWQGYLDNAWRLVSGPLRYETDDWINVGIVLGGAAGLLLLDEPFNDFWQDTARSFETDNVADVFNEVGNVQNYYFGAVGLLSAAEIMGWQREKAAALLTMQAVTLAIPVVGGLKYIIGRDRPDEENVRSYHFRGPAKDDINASMISGHATYAFTAAAVFSELYGATDPWVPWVGYGLASTFALSRINDERHWLSDVFVGGSIGVFIGKMVVRYSPFLAAHDISVLPFTASGAPGLTLAYRY